MRYLPLTETDRQEMLTVIGVKTIDALFADVPASARLKGLIDLPTQQSELEVERILVSLAAKNLPTSACPSFLGGGAYRHHIPAAVDHLIQRSEFLTSYTPYQPEIAQGTLQALFEFQTQVAMITGMEVANASMYDGASACAEAVLMASRLTKRHKAVLSGGLHPHYRDTTITTLAFANEKLVSLPADPLGEEDASSQIDEETACVVVQHPSVFGHIRDLAPLAEACHKKGALLIVAVTEVVALGLLQSPGAMGADIVVAEGQSIGVPLGFGGPYVGLFATREKFLRQMPGRLCGETIDQEGKRGFVLTLSAREQHIRREKATSNICTNAGLCALAFSIHLTLLGEEGFTALAKLNHANAVLTAERLEKIRGVEILNRSFFNEFTVRLPAEAALVVERLAAQRILAGVPVSRLFPDQGALANLLMIATTEMNSPSDIAALGQALEGAL